MSRNTNGLRNAPRSPGLIKRVTGHEGGDAAQIDFINEAELVVWPNGETHEMQYLINGEEAEARSWVFKHK